MNPFRRGILQFLYYVESAVVFIAALILALHFSRETKYILHYVIYGLLILVGFLIFIGILYAIRLIFKKSSYHLTKVEHNHFRRISGIDYKKVSGHNNQN